MKIIPKEQIIKRYQSLPEILQRTIFSENTEYAIARNCSLRDIADDQAYSVGRLTGRILLGYLRPELFALEIQKETGMDMQKAQLVAHDLDAEIFSAVRLELKKLYPPTIQTPTVQTWMGQKSQQQDLQATSYQLQANEKLPTKPKYVIPIPEKFLRPETTNNLRPAQTEQKPENQSGEVRPPTTNNLPPPQPQKTTNTSAPAEIQRMETKPLKPVGGSQTPEKSNTNTNNTEKITQTPPSVLPATSYKLQANKNPVFKPIVPLPTFIQTQFKQTTNDQRPTTNDEQQNLQANEKLPAPPPALQATSYKLQANSNLADDPNIKDFMSKFTTSPTQKPKPAAENPYREKV